MIRPLLLFFILSLCLAMPVFAQVPGINTENNKGTQSVQIDKEQLGTLIETLESDTARQEFINNLKALAEASEENTTKDEAILTDQIGLRSWTQNLIVNYEEFIAAHNLNSSLVGKAGLTGIATLVVFFLLFVLRRATRALRNWVIRQDDRDYIPAHRLQSYTQAVRKVGHLIIAILFIYTICLVWGVTDFGFVNNDMLMSLIGSIFSIFLVVAIAVVIWEVLNAFLENWMHKIDHADSSRMRTILPIIRNVVFFAFSILFTLVLLSEIGINITPLLAGAGIFGIAIGFGAQTVVKDFLTGFTIILEDLIQVGDVVKIGDRIGVIEKITMRKVQLRDVAGIVYTVPFSDITIIENWTKDFSYYVMDIGVAYRENTDEVISYLHEIDEDLRSDENYKSLILEPLEVLGVDAFADSAVIIKTRIKTRPVQQWKVGREFNRRMKFKFDEKGIEIPFPHQTIYFGEDKNGQAPPAHIMVKELADQKKK